MYLVPSSLPPYVCTHNNKQLLLLCQEEEKALCTGIMLYPGMILTVSKCFVDNDDNAMYEYCINLNR